MREILFRGKMAINGEWAFSKCPTATMTCGVEKYDFIPETVGQFTGLTDKNGKKIFEGDIVHVHDCLLKPSAPYHEFDGVVEHKDASFVIVNDCMTHYRWLDYDVTVLGNIHDNPELLEGEEK